MLPTWSVSDVHDDFEARSFLAAKEQAGADVDRLIGLFDEYDIRATAHRPATPADGDAAEAVIAEYNRVAAARFARGEDVTRMATIAKLNVGKLSRQVADACVQYHGGMGYAEENWPARYMRDTRLISIGGGADEVMLRILSLMEGMGRR